jgi:predicted nucleotidyltransferase
MRAKPTLADVLFGKGRGAILGLLYGHPDRSFYYRQLTRELGGISVGTIQRELETLSQLELVTRSAIGNQIFYQANRSHPVFSELRALVAKTVGAFQELNSALAPMADRILLAFVYGSMARQEDKAESDIDLMVIGEVKLEEVLDRLSPVEKTLGRPVNTTLYGTAEFSSKLASGNHFLNSVVSGDKVFLIGGEDELGEFRTERLDHSASDKSRRGQKPAGNRLQGNR